MAIRDDVRSAVYAEVDGMLQQVRAVLDSTDVGPRAEFRRRFRMEEDFVARATATAFAMLSVFTFWLRDDDIDRIRVVGMLNTALNLQLSSFKLFMSGHTVASGSLFRQVIEGVSLAFLFSVRQLPFLQRFQTDQYSARHAVRDLGRHATDARLQPRAMETIDAAYHFYHRFAHLSKLTIAASANFSKGGIAQLGASFDSEKLPEYRKEARNRVSFARVLPNAVLGVCGNLSLW